MLARVIAAVSSPGNLESGVNEDAYWCSPSGAVVLDGITGFAGERLTSGPTDANWLVSAVVSNLNNHAEIDEPFERRLESSLRAAVQDLQQGAAALVESHRTPMAALGAVSIVGDRLRYWLLGDVEAIIRLPSRDAFRKQDTRCHSSEQRTLLEWKRLSEGRLTYSERRKAVRPLIRESRRTINTSEGYWLFSLTNPDLAQAIAGELAVEAGTRILLASDGLLRCSAILGIDDATYFEDGDEGIRTLLERLRRCEQDDSECLRWPRLKRHDDATAVLLEITR
ncbi:serine/threonine protein phosphatase PrpC [Bradyrhizobium sp. USDA 4369]